MAMSWKIFWSTIHDEHGEKEHLLVLLDRILKITFVLIIIGSLFSIFIMPLSAYKLLATGAALLLFLIVVIRLLLWRRLLMPASILFLFSLWASFVLLTIFNSGVSSPAPTTFIFGVLVAGLLLGDRAAKVFAGLTVLTTAVLYAIEVTQGLPPAPLPLTPTTGLIGFIILLLATTGVYSLTIRKLQRTIQALSASEAEMRAIFQAMTDAVFVMDIDGRYTKIAPTSNATILIAHDEMLHKTVYDVVPPKQARELHDYGRRVIASQQPLQVEYSLQVGTPNWWEARIAPLGANEVVWIARDITKRKQTEEALRHSEANLREAQQIAKLGNFEFNLRTEKVQWSDEVYRIFGLEIGTAIDLEQYQGLLAPEDFQRVMAAVTQAITSQQPYTIEHDIILPDGQRKHLYAIGRSMLDTTGQASRIFGIVQDVTESKRVEQTLRENMARYRALFEHANDAIWVCGLDDKVMTANSRACELSGYSLEEMIGQEPDFFTVPEEYDGVYSGYQEVMVHGESPPIYERTLVRKNGEKRICEIRASRVEDDDGKPLYIQGVVRDVTERRRTEAQIQASLQEKEILLKEIHHRVKNNLQVISSLLDLQAAYVKDESVLEMFQESRSRVRSMALVHEQLYQSADLARIDFADYINGLTGYLLRVYGHLVKSVTLDIDVANTFLSVETAVPLGLIVNELVSNALKHAFPDGRSGQIRVRLTPIEDDQIHLVVQDNGIGFPANIDFRRSSSLGLTIIMTLMNQLRGEIALHSQDGARFELTVPNEGGEDGAVRPIPENNDLKIERISGIG